MIADFGAVGQKPWNYQDNYHVLYNGNATNAGYADGWAGSTFAWHVATSRNGIYEEKFWPKLQAPSGLTAVAVSMYEIDLSWTDNNATDGTGFGIYRSHNNIFDGLIATTLSPSFADPSLDADTEYVYCVFALNQQAAGPLGTPGPTGRLCSDSASDRTFP